MTGRAAGPLLRLVRDEAKKPAAEPSGGQVVDDDALVAAVLRGDDRAALAFHNRLRPRVVAVIRRLLGRGSDDIEDLVQMAMIGLVESLHAFRGECSLDTWAQTIAARVVYKYIRRRRVERRLFAAAEGNEADTRPAASAGRSIVLRDLASRVRMHLGTMDSDKSWAFLLHDVGGFDLREIAEITGVSVAAAQKRLVRGRSEIHERLSNDPQMANALTEVEAEA